LVGEGLEHLHLGRREASWLDARDGDGADRMVITEHRHLHDRSPAARVGKISHRLARRYLLGSDDIQLDVRHMDGSAVDHAAAGQGFTIHGPAHMAEDRFARTRPSPSSGGRHEPVPLDTEDCDGPRSE
jgi:hypothetical protein